MKTDDIYISKLLARIQFLERKIEEFKEYDKKRSEYYKESMVKPGQLESFVDEVCDTNQLASKLKAYKETIKIHKKRAYLDKIAKLSEIEVISTYDKMFYESKIENLQKDIKTLRKNNETLILQRCKLRSKELQLDS